MSERSLFAVRYAFPGYTFLLFVILLCCEQIPNFLDVTQFGLLYAFFAFVYLLSGAPIGYFITQPWYIYFHHIKKGYFWNGHFKKRKKKYIEYICDEIDKDIQINDNNPDNAVVILDYLYNGSEDKKYLSSYLTRRWDLYHVMGSTEGSILFGIIFGILFKLYLNKGHFIKINRIFYVLNLFSFGDA